MPAGISTALCVAAKFVLLCLACVLGSVTASAANAWCDRSWDTEWASSTGPYKSPLTLTCIGNHVHGIYNDGVVDAAIAPDNQGRSTLLGKWTRTTGGSGGTCKDGRLFLVLGGNDLTFSGFWTFCNDSPTDVTATNVTRWAWTGTVVSQTLPSSGSPVGSGGNSCGGTATCRAGKMCCDGRCVVNDPLNCGGCGVICQDGSACQGQHCVGTSMPPQSCAMVNSFCVPDTQPLPDGQPAAHCCNSQGRNPGTAELCVEEHCRQCFRHGDEVPAGGSQVCCEFGEVVKFDQFTQKAVCDIPDTPNQAAPHPPRDPLQLRSPLRLQSRPEQPNIH